MQSQDQQTRTPDALTHPGAAEWMAFLYGEVAPERKRELETHHAQCPACAAKVKEWRAGLTALDEWALPVPRATSPASRPVLRELFPALKWAAAAAVVLLLGFGLGRRTSPAATEIGALKASVGQLTESAQREQRRGWSNSVDIATLAANMAILRLLADSSQWQTQSDQQTLALALADLEGRLGRLRAELETVAVNTENGFEQTHQNLTRLASHTLPAQNKPTEP